MGRKATITEDQERRVITLYANHVPVPAIIADTGIASKQTIYRIIRKHGIEPNVNRKRYARTISVALDEDTDYILRTINPAKTSAWVCDLIKRTYPEVLSHKKEG